MSDNLVIWPTHWTNSSEEHSTRRASWYRVVTGVQKEIIWEKTFRQAVIKYTLEFSLYK